MMDLDADVHLLFDRTLTIKRRTVVGRSQGNQPQYSDEDRIVASNVPCHAFTYSATFKERTAGLTKKVMLAILLPIDTDIQADDNLVDISRFPASESPWQVMQAYERENHIRAEAEKIS